MSLLPCSLCEVLSTSSRNVSEKIRQSQSRVRDPPPFKVVPWERAERPQRFCHDRKLSWKSFCVTVYSAFCDLSWIFSTASNLRPFNLIFVLGWEEEVKLMAFSSRDGREVHPVFNGIRRIDYSCTILCPSVRPPHVLTVTSKRWRLAVRSRGVFGVRCSAAYSRMFA
jgi:hypothetical protein